MLVSRIHALITQWQPLIVTTGLALLLTACGSASNGPTVESNLDLTVIAANDTIDPPTGDQDDTPNGSEDKPDDSSDKPDDSDDGADDPANDGDSGDPDSDSSDPTMDQTALPLIDVPVAHRDLAGNTFLTTNNNAARLQGPVIGSGELRNKFVRRRVRLEVAADSTGTANSPIVVNQIYVAQHPGGFANLTAVIHNTSNDWLCDIELTNVMLNDNNNEPLADQLFNATLISAMSLGRTNDGVINNACLAPNERGYAIMAGSFNHRDVASVAIGSVSYSPGRALPQNDRIEPIAYNVTNNAMQLSLANRSTVSATINAATLVILDAGGLPLSNGTMQLALELAPGEEITINIQLSFAGSASSARLIIDATPRRTPEPILDPPSPNSWQLARGNSIDVPLTLTDCRVAAGSRVAVTLEDVRVVNGPSRTLPFQMDIQLDQITSDRTNLLMPVAIGARESTALGQYDLRFTVVARSPIFGIRYCSSEQELTINVVE